MIVTVSTAESRNGEAITCRASNRERANHGDGRSDETSDHSTPRPLVEAFSPDVHANVAGQPASECTRPRSVTTRRGNTWWGGIVGWMRIAMIVTRVLDGIEARITGASDESGTRDEWGP